MIPQQMDVCNSKDVINFLIDFSSKEKVIDSVQIAKRFGIRRIEVRRIINKARSEGTPICSTSNGYYFSTDEADILKTVNSLSGRVNAINKAIMGMTAYIGSTKYYDNLL